MENRGNIINMNPTYTAHACVCICLSIHQANCGQPQTAPGCQLRHSSSCATSPSICLCLPCSVICLSAHSSSSHPLHTHPPASSAVPCLLPLSANLSSCICLTFPLSASSLPSLTHSFTQCVPRGKSSKDQNASGCCCCCSNTSAMTSNRS